MGRLQRLVTPRIIRGAAQAFMRKTAIWAVFVAVCGVERVRPGRCAGAGRRVTPDIFWLNIRWDDHYAKN